MSSTPETRQFRETITLSADVTEIAGLNAWLDDLAKIHGMTKAEAHDVKLCVNEAVTNAISYGRMSPGSGYIAVEIAGRAGDVGVVIRDNGLPFNPVDAPPPLPFRDALTASVGGLGIQIIRQTTSTMRYSREADENVLSLRFGPQPTVPR